MIKAELKDGEKTAFTLDIPEEWDEMTSEQVRYTFEQYERLVTGEISKKQFEILVLYRIIGILHGPTMRSSINPEIIQNVNTLCNRLQFLYSYPEQDTPRLSFRSIQNPLPFLKVRGRTFLGPATLCQDLTFGEFRNAAMSLNTYFNTEDPAALHECIAHLYRPRAMKANKAGRKVKPANAGTFGDDIRAMSSIEPWQKNLIMLWFASCINYLQTGTLVLSGEEVDLQKLFTESDEPEVHRATWNDLLIQIAKEGSIGTTDIVDDSPLMVILLHMWSNYKENKRNERNLKKAQKS